jgi:uncharacterized protein (TIGR02271 family)
MADMRTVVGLFEEASEARRVIAELTASDIAVSNIHEISNAPESAHLIETITSYIGEPDVRFYQEGVRRGETLVVVTAPERDAQRAAEIMARYNMIDVDARSTEYRNAGASYSLRDYAESDYVLPVVEEELQIGKRSVERGRMRVYSHVVETPVEEQVRLRDETVRVERRPVDRPVSDADVTAMKDRSFEVSELHEEAVVSKRARVIEEVVVRKETSERDETVRDTVRRTDVNVEQVGGGATSKVGDFARYDTDFRTHYQQNFANSGHTYDEYAPMYRYGHSLATHEHYRDREWAEVEPEARKSWEQSNPGTWENLKGGVQYAWDKARGRR